MSAQKKNESKSEMDRSDLSFCIKELGLDAREIKGVNPVLKTTTIPFIFPDIETLPFKRLRNRFDFCDVIKNKDEFQAQLELAHWVHSNIYRSEEVAAMNNPLEILELSRKKTVGFYCSHFAVVYSACANAAGFTARTIAVDSFHTRHEDSTHHGTNEIYSSVFRKWFLIDSMHGCIYQKKQIPLSAYEIAEEWLANKGKNIDIYDFNKKKIVEKSPKRTLNNQHESSAYYFFYTGILMDPFYNSGTAYPRRTLFFEDQERKKHVWYQGNAARSHRHGGYSGAFLHTSRLDDFYFDVNTVHINTRPLIATGDIAISFETLTPNFSHFLYRFDNGNWHKLSGSKPWNKRDGGYEKKDGKNGVFPDVLLHEIRWKIKSGGHYSVEVKPVNRSGREGASSCLDFVLK